MSIPDAVLILTTAPDAERANVWARVLVEERLVACANIHPPMTSIYRWKGNLEQNVECQLVLKTVRARIPELRVRLGKLHSYDLPEFLVVSIEDGSDEYVRWVTEETRP